jgi:integrase
MSVRFWIESYRVRSAKSGKRYRIRWQGADGRKHTHPGTHERKRDAENVLAELKRREALGPLHTAPVETLASFMGARPSGGKVVIEGGGWLRRYRQRVRPKTFANCAEILPNLLPIMARELSQLHPQEVEDHVYAVAERAPRQAQVTLQLLKSVLRNARARGHVVNDGILAIRPPALERRERFFLGWEQVEALANAMSRPYRNLVRFAAQTGLREGECFGLRDRDVDLEAGSVRVEHGVYKGGLVQLKTKASRRVVDLSPLAARLLREQLLARVPNAEGLLFPNPQGGVQNANNFRRRVFVPACRAAGMPAGFHFHDLRHTYAALMIRAGAEAKYLQAQMGHSSIRTTYDEYGHLFPNANRAVLGAFDELTRTKRPTIAPSRSEEQLSLDDEIERIAGGSGDGRAWDRTRDLPRVKAARPVSIGR